MTVSNCSSSDRTVERPLHVMMSHFDLLPKTLRDLLNRAPVKFDSAQALDLFRRASAVGGSAWAERMTAHAIEKTAHAELSRFAADHAVRFGAPLPHVAAGATVMR